MSVRAQYESIIRAWMKARAELPSGSLTQEQEAEWANKADDLWWQLSEKDQNEVEAMHASGAFTGAT